MARVYRVKSLRDAFNCTLGSVKQPTLSTNEVEMPEKKMPERNPVAAWEKSNKNSRALAVKAKCAECMGCNKDHREPGFAIEVKKCTTQSCPLWVFRPYQEKAA